MIYHGVLAGPGLAIRVLCATEPYKGADYDATNQLLAALVGSTVEDDAIMAKAKAAVAGMGAEGVFAAGCCAHL
jgi:hypothetical protein